MSAATVSVAFVASIACASQPGFAVNFDQDQYAGGADAAVTISLFPRYSPIGPKRGTLPAPYRNPSAYWLACSTSVALKADALDPETFCSDPKTQTSIASGNEEPIQDIASGAAASHTFGKQLRLPQYLVGSQLWIVVMLTYYVPGTENPKVLYAWTDLLYRCQGGSSKESRVSCAYYTKARYAITQVGPVLNKKPPPVH
ncbi:MAG TPA: hypothetical protein VH814_17420 [Steroidobacteraceae bacterium]|jgi:hypothetical protein